MDDPLADGAMGRSMAAVGGSNVDALLARGAEAGCSAGLLDGVKKLARRSKEKSPPVGAAVAGAGAIGSSPLFAAAPNRFACQVLARAAERAGSSSCSTTDWSLELDGGPGGSDVA